MVLIYTEQAERANALAAEGDFLGAARLRAKSALYRFHEFGIQENASSEIAVGDLLYAVYYATRGGDEQLAAQLRNTLESYASLLQHAAYDALQENWPATTRGCLIGMFEEWVGDAHLMTRSAEANRYYARAEPWYRIKQCRVDEGATAKEMPCWQWGMEPAFEVPNWAFADFLEWRYAGLSEDVFDYHLDFFDRLDFKHRILHRQEEDSV